MAAAARILELEKELVGTYESIRVDRKAHKQEIQALKAQLWDGTLSKSTAFSTEAKRPASSRSGPSSKRFHTGSSEELVELVPHTLREGSSDGYYKCLVPDPTNP